MCLLFYSGVFTVFILFELNISVNEDENFSSKIQKRSVKYAPLTRVTSSLCIIVNFNSPIGFHATRFLFVHAQSVLIDDKKALASCLSCGVS